MTLAARLRRLDWDALIAALEADGYAVSPPLLEAGECDQLIGLFSQDDYFRSTVDMRRLRFGSGVYRYFARPMPKPVETLRRDCYPPLAEVANAWAERLGQGRRYPTTLEAFLALCHNNGQTRPTPILFRYASGDYNALHQDVYGEIAFPLQIVIVLSPPDAYIGGEFVLTTQRPRAQSLVEVVNPVRGQLLVFPNQHKPALGHSGRYHRTNIRHGVSRLRSGERHSLGIIFHDAK